MDLSCNEIMNLNDAESDDLGKCSYKEQISSDSYSEPHQEDRHTQPQQQLNYISHHQQQIQPAVKKKSVITKLYFEACQDPIFLNDRCLNNLLTSEKHYPTPQCFYFTTIQKNLTPNMRRLVAEWVIELCEEEKCQEEVAILAINYMDRVLNKIPFSKTNLQLLAATCVFLASKLREPSTRALPPHILVYYTDNSITKRDIMDTELLVLSCLKWDVSCVTPLDFLELLITRLPIQNKNCEDILPETIRKHAQAFISIAIKEHDFSVFSASTIAAASIAASLMGLKWHIKSNIAIMDLIDKLSDLIKCDNRRIICCVNKMETLYQDQKRMLYLATAQSMKRPLMEQKQMPYQEKEGHSITPVDIQDVHF